MEIRINISDELAGLARSRGVPIEKYIEEILAQQVGTRTPELTSRSPEQIRSWLDALAQFSDRIPPLPESISREWIYQDHD